MPLVLRFIREHRWHKSEAAQELLNNDDLPGDPFSDLSPIKDNQLSVWLVEDDHSNLDRVIRAFALSREKIDNVGFLLFPEAVLAGAKVDISAVDGDTPDAVANKWHRNLTVTGSKLFPLAKGMFIHGTSDQIPKKQLTASLQTGVQNKEFPASALEKFNKKKCDVCGK